MSGSATSYFGVTCACPGSRMLEAAPLWPEQFWAGWAQSIKFWWKIGRSEKISRSQGPLFWNFSIWEQCFYFVLYCSYFVVGVTFDIILYGSYFAVGVPFEVSYFISHKVDLFIKVLLHLFHKLGCWQMFEITVISGLRFCLKIICIIEVSGHPGPDFLSRICAHRACLTSLGAQAVWPTFMTTLSAALSATSSTTSSVTTSIRFDILTHQTMVCVRWG